MANASTNLFRTASETPVAREDVAAALTLGSDADAILCALARFDAPVTPLVGLGRAADLLTGCVLALADGCTHTAIPGDAAGVRSVEALAFDAVHALVWAAQADAAWAAHVEFDEGGAREILDEVAETLDAAGQIVESLDSAALPGLTAGQRTRLASTASAVLAYLTSRADYLASDGTNRRSKANPDGEPGAWWVVRTSGLALVDEPAEREADGPTGAGRAVAWLDGDEVARDVVGTDAHRGADVDAWADVDAAEVDAWADEAATWAAMHA